MQSSWDAEGASERQSARRTDSERVGATHLDEGDELGERLLCKVTELVLDECPCAAGGGAVSPRCGAEKSRGQGWDLRGRDVLRDGVGGHWVAGWVSVCALLCHGRGTHWLMDAVGLCGEPRLASPNATSNRPIKESIQNQFRLLYLLLLPRPQSNLLWSRESFDRVATRDKVAGGGSPEWDGWVWREHKVSRRSNDDGSSPECLYARPVPQN